MNLNQTFTISDEVICQVLDDESVLLDLASENYLGLDEVGTRIWQLIDDGETMRSVVATMLDEYDTNEDTLVGDLDKFLNDLQAQGLITPVG
ncbi:MAG: PqqD family protein [Gammaproteobacteria bacterium]|jgi:hypothetical protein|nr:PqqD family protein [Gammaproteobacteria bacterium]MBT3868282.1 PqqD family protein [Gammaproteobacteria bacterium]MBT4381099.1 PqqD family protein [Gammaproteobacteria bacterium]MBT4615845.1 PqqD family protein [Gammaproteobacteria bacterium]MBT5196567.1 PqqD family protein [Gammaproteobacteria bacterium]